MALRPSHVAGVVAGCAVLIGLAAPAALAQGPATASDGRVPIVGGTPSWATPTARIGTPNPNQQRHVDIALSLPDQAGAAALATAVSSPGSAQHGHYLTNAEFNARFAPTQQSVDQVTAWLRGEGLRVDAVAGNHHFVDAVGSIAQLQTAFGTQLGIYRYRAGGHSYLLDAPSAPISVPASLQHVVSAVVGLDDSGTTFSTNQTSMRTTAGEPVSATPQAGNPQSCAPYWGATNNPSAPQKYGSGAQSNYLCGYNDTQIRSIYGLSPANTGTNQTVAFTGAYDSATIVADTNRAAQTFGAPQLLPGQYSEVLPSSYTDQDQCDPQAWVGEQSLDLQSIHEVAPSAKVIYYADQSCNTLFDGINNAVAADTASVISNSWGFSSESAVPQATRDQMNAIAVQAAIQGQAVSFSTGDSGDNSAPSVDGTPQASFPASNPWVTAVGGTSVALDSSNHVTWTTGWENSGNVQQGNAWTPEPQNAGGFAGGAGGGVSGVYDEPSYQMTVVPPAYAQGHRAVPDVGLLADSYTGIGIGLTTPQGWVTYSSGGTSLASPLLVGLVADAQQSQGVSRLGFLNNALYQMKSGISDVTDTKAGVWSPFMASFGGVTVPSQPGSYLLDLGSKPQSLVAAPGWDNVTGVGTPSAGFLAALGN